MSKGLEEILHSLHESIDASQPNRELSDVLVEDIQQICTNEISGNDVDLTCGLLFHKSTGLVKFLQKSAKIEELQNAKANALVLLSEFIQKAEKKILPYAVDIKNACVTVYSLDRFAKVKNSAIPVLIKVLELTAGAAMGNDLDIESLIIKFFGELSKPTSKLAASVRASIYNLLGVIAEVFPDSMAPYEDKLVGIYVGALKTEMTAQNRKAELPVIAGCLEGLTAFLLNFTQSIQEGSKYSYEIFKYARMAIDPKISYTRYDVPRAGLKLFARHAGQFKTFLMDEYTPMYEKFSAWSRHNNRDVLHLGIAALEAFVREISEILVERAKEGQNEAAVFKFFLLEFRNIMNSKFSTPKEVSTAIRGYGLLAAPCRTFLTEEDVQFMFGEMITQCEHQFFGPPDDLIEQLLSVPSYLTALANIVKQVDMVPASYALVLERLVIMLIENIPQVNKPQQFLCFKSILLLLLTLIGKPAVFSQMLESIVYQGLLRTCSHPIVTETNETDEVPVALRTEVEAMPVVTYKDYLFLWSTLLESAKIKDLAADDFTIADRTALTEALYNQLMATVIKVLNKLNLDASGTDHNDAAMEVEEENESLSADPTSGVTAKRPKDFQIFINLVDFCKDLLLSVQWRYFQRWVLTFSHTLIALSTRNPLVSGFYKLLYVTMTIANKLDYFMGLEKQLSSQGKVSQDSMEVDESKEARDAYMLVKKFSKEVLVRIKQFKDDLLASCLTLILSLPKEIIMIFIEDIVPAIQTTFTIGLSYLPLAMVGLHALEQWSQLLPSYVLAPYYKDILPCLDAYLRTDLRGSEESSADLTIPSKSKSSSKRKKIPTRLLQVSTERNGKSSSTQLNQVKQRILHYLGSLGGEINQELFANASEDVSKQAIAWDTRQHLRFDIPFFDMKPVIYFDQFLPHVVNLAQHSSDRKTKVAACELLHSLMLYSLGRGAHMPGQTRQVWSMEQLYRRLFPPLLSLACDVEQVCKDLFQPLILQLIHWFTNKKMAESPETMVLLDSFFDGLIQGENTALRDFSAHCLKEFLEWSLKQISKKDAEKNPINAKSVFKRIKSYALHPSSTKRFGAAMAFNSIYKNFREEEALVDRFTFEILVYFVESLSIAHKDDKSLGTQKQCSLALEHLERIIRVKAELLKKDTGQKKRPEPSSWSSRKLEIALRWLTRQCGSPQTECRQACMKLVYNLCTLLQGIKAPKMFFGVFLKAEGSQYFIERFEGGGKMPRGSNGLLAYPEMSSDIGESSLGKATHWFDMLLAALDCYCWLFQEDLVTPTQIFTGKGLEMSNCFKSVAYFLNKLALGNIETAAAQFEKTAGMVFTPREHEEYNRLKCTVIIRTFNFLSVLLVKEVSETNKVVPAEVWSEDLWKLLCACVVQPTAVGFDMADTEIMHQLPLEMKQVLAVFMKYLSGHQLNDMKKNMSIYLKSECDLDANLPRNLPSAPPNTDWLSLTHMVEGYGQLYSVNLLPQSGNLPQALLDKVFQGIVEKTPDRTLRASLVPTAMSLVRSLLTLALDLGLSAKSLMSAILNKTSVEEASGIKGKTLSQGGLFFTLLGPVIGQFAASVKGRSLVLLLMDRASSDIVTIGGVLVSMLDFIVKDKNLRKSEGPKFSQEILGQWNKLECCWGDKATPHSQSLVLMILTKLLLIDSKCVETSDRSKFKPVFEMYFLMLKDPRTSMSFKNQVLDLLPFFASLKEDAEEQLKDALNRLIANSFPLKSSEFVTGTHQYKDYIVGIDKLLGALEISGSLMLLEVLVSVFCREPQHAHEDAIQAGLARFVRRLPQDKQIAALGVPFSIFVNASGFSSEVRKSAVERVCLPLLRLVLISTVEDFFIKHIHKLVEPLDGKLTKGRESEQLTNRICCFQLLELMYARLPKEIVKSQTSQINCSFCNSKVETGNEMTQKITKSAQEAKSEDYRGEDSMNGLRRQYHCHAYNLMIAIISCVQTELKFFKGFLFQDNIAKGQFLLDNIIDKEKQYEFEIELQSPLERRRQFVSIRNEKKAEIVKSGDGERNGLGGSWVTPSFHLASQYLADSSLNEDVTKYDFSMTSGTGQNEVLPVRSRSSGSISSAFDENTEISMPENYVELEMDALNRHECMPSLIALLKHMVDTKISPEVPKDKAAKDMPVWMVYLHEKLTIASTHVNIKIFVAKLIINCSQIFQPYASFWLRPLCQLLFAPEVSGSGLNYFAVDLIVTMLSWQSVAIPEDSAEQRAMASRVVKFVTGNVYHHNRQIFRSNLDLLKTLLECWHDRVEIPYDIVYHLFKTKEAKSIKMIAGVQVLGVVVMGRFPFYGPSAPVDRDSYLRAFFSLMTNPMKQVYAATAEVTGLILHKLTENTQEESESVVHDHVAALLLNLAGANIGNFIKCVHSIHLSYPAITERFVSKLLFVLPSLPGQFRPLCLEVLLSHVNKMGNAYLELHSKGFLDFLTHRDAETQLVALKIVKGMMISLKSSEMLTLLPAVVAFSSHSSTPCRFILLEILMWAYDNYRDNQDGESSQIMSLTKETLLKGLCDGDEGCRLVCQNFWGSNTRLPEGTLERTLSLLEAMYSPSTETYFLAYATNLLLEATSKSPDYQRPLFEHPLTECSFQDYSVHSSWRQRHAAMTPLFGVTQLSQSQTGSNSTGDYQLEGMVRATQQGGEQFTATMDVNGSGRAFNWLTQSSLDTFAETHRTVTTDTQLLFRHGATDLGSSKQRVKSQAAASTIAEKKALSIRQPRSRQDSAGTSFDDVDGSLQDQDDVWRLKRRFLKDTDSQQIYHARRNIRIKRMREEQQKRQQAMRENEVTLYRKYRIGDFPDIQIKHQCVIAPLQALANRNSTIANLLFRSLFQAIFSQMDQVKSERQIEELTREINQSIEAILSQSVLYYPPFIGCILTILYELRSNLKVSESLLALGATVGNQQILGILILEEQLIQTDSRQVGDSGKRPRLARADVFQQTPLWIELSGLYKSIGEYDMLQGIFSDKLGTKEITQKAIEAEARGDYKAASKLYDEAMKTVIWPDSDPQEAEVDFWEISRMECLDYLTKWKDLESIATQGIDASPTPTLDRVWDDDYYQELYLPYLMRSKLKLMLTGLDNSTPNSSQEDFLNFVNNALKDEQKRQYLQSRYCQELALLFLYKGNYDTARHYTRLAFESFLQSWGSTTTLMDFSRRENLHNLQGLVEQQEFLDCAASLESAGNLSLSKLTRQWQGRSPHPLLDPVSTWDNVITNRNLFLARLAEKIQFSGVNDAMDSQNSELMGDHGKQKLTEMSVSLHLAMAHSCQVQNNFSVSMKIIKNTKDVCNKLHDPENFIKWVHLYAEAHQFKVKNSAQWTEAMLGDLCTTLDQLSKVEKNPMLLERFHVGLKQHVLTGHSLDLLVSCVMALNGISTEAKNKLTAYANCEDSCDISEQIIAGLVKRGYQVLKASASAAEMMINTEELQDSKIMTCEQVNLELAKYCDKYLHLKEDDSLPEACDINTFPLTVVTCLLQAMKGGVTEAIQKFPRLLKIAELYPESHVKDVFIKKAAEIPSWMFLLWVSQMTALLDKPEAVVVTPILRRIAKEYPQAFIYPFRMSSEGYNFGNSTQDKKNQAVCQELENISSNEEVNKFISALEQLGHPDMILKDWCGDMRKLISDKKRSKIEVKKKFLEIVFQLFNVRSVASLDTLSLQTSSTAASVVIGDYRKDFATALKDLFFETFGQDGDKLYSMKSKDFSDACEKITTSIKNLQGQRGSRLKPPTKIKDYCPWMSDFNFRKSGDMLEIPGQYTGLKKPLPEYHVKIAGFDERVLVMLSLRKPIRITIRGNNEKNYPYLVKSGEDLRMDQRIENLFHIMNTVMETDPGCRQRKLQLKTYQVISMTPRVGLIEWMKNTQPLKEFLMNTLSDEEQKYLDPKSGHAPGIQHIKWMEKIAGKDNKRGFPGIFDKVYLKYSYTEAVKEFRLKEGKIPWNLSRRALQRLSSSPEAFYVLRSALLRSHSVVCICQYLLGIGDRHLSNFMVNLKTGQMVGIDFGHAFGSATQFLPVPELMPFRLTRQLTNLNMPLQVKGQMESCMRHVLRALRADSDLLLSTMDVFVKEPSLDWMNFAEKQMQAGAETDDSAEDCKWFPKQKIQFAQRKLLGDHPCYIMKDELELGHSKREAFSSMVKVLMGDKKIDMRATLPAKDLSVEQQVAALIDHATDPNILGRTWGGWEPWV